MKIVSWNVNGILAWLKKNGDQALVELAPDIICIQEVKTKNEVNFIDGYYSYFNLSKRGNYGGTLILTKEKPLSVTEGMGIGRAYKSNILTLEYESFFIVNCYCPSSVYQPKKQEKRMEWDDRFLYYIHSLSEIMPVILCGDFNVQYCEDYRDPRLYKFEMDKNQNILKLKEFGFSETFSYLYPGKKIPTSWWNPKGKKMRVKEGRTLDYFFLSETLIRKATKVTYHKEIFGSDHCPVELEISLDFSRGEKEKEFGNQWKRIDWNEAKAFLKECQRDLARAARAKDDELVTLIQKKMHDSLLIRELAVEKVFNDHFNSVVSFKSEKINEMKMQMALNLSVESYEPRPYFEFEHEEKGKLRRFGHFSYTDKAMHRLVKWTLSPILEATTDTHSFAFRQKKGVQDAHAYLKEVLESDESLEYIVYIDIKKFYDNIDHKWLIENVPVNKSILKKILGALSMYKGEITQKGDVGISLGSSLSPFLANYILEGLQSRLYLDLYGEERPDDRNVGDIIRFADDIVIVVNSEEIAVRVLRSVQTFLEERKLEINMEKSKVASVYDGFDYMSWNYKKYGDNIVVVPTRKAIDNFKLELKKTINDKKVSLKRIIEKVNHKLTGWGIYHRYSYAEEAFWEIDCEVKELFRTMVKKRWRINDQKFEKDYTITLNGSVYYTLPNDKSVQIIHLSDIPLAQHKRVNLDANPFLDDEYYKKHDEDHDMRTVTGEYRAIWNRQKGLCAVCGEPILANEDILAIPKESFTSIIDKFKYVHKDCFTSEFLEISSPTGLDYHADMTAVNLLLKDNNFVSDSFLELNTRGQYEQLRQYFHNLDANKISLSIEELENINGESFAPGIKKDGVLKIKKRNTLKSVFKSEGFIYTGKLGKDKDVTTFIRVSDGSFRLDWPKKLSDKVLGRDAEYEINRFLKFLEKRFG